MVLSSVQPLAHGLGLTGIALVRGLEMRGRVELGSALRAWSVAGLVGLRNMGAGHISFANMGLRLLVGLFSTHMWLEVRGCCQILSIFVTEHVVQSGWNT